MKRMILLSAIMMAMFFSAGTAQATAKDAGVMPQCDAAGNCIIPDIPNGTLLVIEIYNDYTHKPIRRVEGRSFNLEPGDSINYTWRDTAGTWFGYIDPGSPVPDNLANDCRRADGCKWLRVPPWEKNTAEVMMPGSVFTPKP